MVYMDSSLDPRLRNARLVKAAKRSLMRRRREPYPRQNLNSDNHCGNIAPAYVSYLVPSPGQMAQRPPGQPAARYFQACRAVCAC